MLIGTAPVSWGACELPDWGRQEPWARVLDEMAACGYAGTELGPPGFLPSDPPTLRRELDARGLALIGAFCPVPVGDGREARRLARETATLLAACGAPVLVVAAYGDAEWPRACATLDEIAADARGLGVVTALHPHAESFVETPEDIARAMAGTDPGLVSLCLDTGHVAYGGGDIVEVARRYSARVRHVHLKDLRRSAPQGGGLRDAVGRGVFAPLGEGDLDLRGALAALPGYDGWIVVEQDVRLGVTPNAEPLRDARHSRTFLREALGR